LIADALAEETAEKIRKAGPFDLIFFDTLHEYGQVSAEWALYKSQLRPGGIAVFHDIKINPGMVQFWSELEIPKIQPLRENGSSTSTSFIGLKLAGIAALIAPGTALRSAVTRHDPSWPHGQNVWHAFTGAECSSFPQPSMFDCNLARARPSDSTLPCGSMRDLS
jgi:hypothetical protein